MESNGPLGWRNWRSSAGGRVTYTHEYPIFTDADFVGQVDCGLGPYKLLNTIRRGVNPDRFPAAILRADWHLDPNEELAPAASWKTETSFYHAGDFADELASLVSLCLGIRVQAGGPTRLFGGHVDDPRGQPIAYQHKRVSALPQPSFQASPILPLRSRDVNLGELLSSPLIRYPVLDEDSAAALVQSARLYQEAIWIAEGRPEWSWVLLVSAVERAAARWQKVTVDPVAWLKELEPSLEREFNAASKPELFGLVAKKLSKYIGSTRRFWKFVLEFLPPAPAVRPPAGCRLSWTKTSIEKAMKTVYGWRSKYLHEAVPFPAPMCERPYSGRGWTSRSEIPLGLGTKVPGGTWLKKDVPMMLHVFEYIVRHALLKWWAGMTSHAVDINSATFDELISISGIGRRRAEAILSFREEKGRFSSHSALRQIPSIGESLAETLVAHTTLASKQST